MTVGMMNFATEWKVIKFMFQTTNQMTCSHFFGAKIPLGNQNAGVSRTNVT
jgi:hypothetical protein